MSREFDTSTFQQDKSVVGKERNTQKENRHKKLQTGTDRTIEDISITIHPLVTMPTSDMTMNYSTIPLRKQDSNSVNLEVESSPPQLPQKNLIDYIQKNSLNLAEPGTTHTKVKLPKRKTLMVFILLTIGLISLTAGIFTAAFSGEAITGVVFWSVAVICFIPGIFYARKLHQAFRSRNKDAKNNAIQEIPE